MAVKTLVPKLQSRERVLVYGGSGVGKSSCFLSIAAAVPTSRFYVWDGDDSYERLIETSEEVFGVDLRDRNVEWEVADFMDWQESLDCLDRLIAKGERDDWLAVDMIGQFWDRVQDFYNENVFGKTTAEYFLSKRQQLEVRRAAENKTSGGALGTYEQNTDWTAIKKIFDGEVHKRLLRWSGHLFIMSEESKLGDGDNKELRASFGHIGFKPKGHSRTPHLAQSVFHLRRIKPTSVVITTAKDRGRAVFEDDSFGNFVQDYLRPIAGWTVKVHT